MDIKILTYEEFVTKHKKYDGKCECAMPWCEEPAYYEGGDARCWFPVCEKHALMSEQYYGYLIGLRRSIRTRMIWCTDDESLISLLVRVSELIESRKKHSV